MLPKNHIISGLIFSLLIFFIFPKVPLYGLILVFLSSFLIDIDHYISAVIKTNNFSLTNAFAWQIKDGNRRLRNYRNGKKEMEPFHPFHTFEFHLIVLLIGLIYQPFLFIFAGIVFHSIIDIYCMSQLKILDSREFFLTSWLIRKSL